MDKSQFFKLFKKEHIRPNGEYYYIIQFMHEGTKKRLYLHLVNKGKLEELYENIKNTHKIVLNVNIIPRFELI